ncbi:MAG: uroporphyrinogen-III synthase [Actinomycetota bacterium]|nr:uroporphyrinogen-III synthase [Actinomycetota bacterium]
MTPLRGVGAAPFPLAGTTVVVTRARAQAATLVARLEVAGATVVELPVIALADPSDGGAALRGAADALVVGAYDWVALTSANGAARLAAALAGRPVPATTRWAAVGVATARALAAAGHPPDLVPGDAEAAALAGAFPPVPGSSAGGSCRVLFPRAETVHGNLAGGLRAKGYRVDEVVAYRTVAGRPDATAVAAARRADAVVFTSSSTVERTVALLGPDGVPPVVASIGPATSATARRAGLAVSAEAAEHSVDGLVDALVAALGR